MKTTVLRWALCAHLLAPALLAVPPCPRSLPVGGNDAATLAPSPDEAFSDLTVEDALARAEKEDRLVLLFFDNPGSPEARRMLTGTFTDANVIAWIRDHAIAVKIASDDLRNHAKYSVSRFPTTLLLDAQRKLLLQLQDHRDATQLLVAVNSVMLGLRDVARPDGDQAENPMAWMAWGNHLFNNDPGRADEALEAYLWALDRGDEFLPGFRDMHLEFLLERIAYLKPHTPDAVQALWDRRAALRAKILGADAEPHDLDEYLRFSYWLRDEDDSLTLFEELAELDTERGAQMYDLIVRSELKRIVAWRHYEAVLEVEPDPKGHLEARVAAYEKAAEESGTPDAEDRKAIVDDAADYFECLLGTGKGADAMELATVIAEKFTSGRTYRAFIERTNRLEFFKLSERLGEAGLANVEGKGRRLIELELHRAKRMQEDRSLPNAFDQATGKDDDGHEHGDGGH